MLVIGLIAIIACSGYLMYASYQEFSDLRSAGDFAVGTVAFANGLLGMIGAVLALLLLTAQTICTLCG